MKKKLTLFTFAAFTLFWAGCASTTTFSHIEEVSTEIPAAPDVHGANGNQIRPFSLRGNANLHISKEDDIKISGIKNERKHCKVGRCDSDTLLGSSDYATAYYKTSSLYGSGGFDGLVSAKPLLFGFGFQYNHGFYTHLSMGINTRHFELGALAGLWIMHRHQKYSGQEFICSYNPSLEKKTFTEDYFEESTNYTLTGSYGGYASLYNGPLFITYSLNIYKPTIDADDDDSDYLEGYDIDLPYVFTHHINVGYRFLHFLEYHIGMTFINGDFKSPDPEVNTGISVYML